MKVWSKAKFLSRLSWLITPKENNAAIFGYLSGGPAINLFLLFREHLNVYSQAYPSKRAADDPSTLESTGSRTPRVILSSVLNNMGKSSQEPIPLLRSHYGGLCANNEEGTGTVVGELATVVVALVTLSVRYCHAGYGRTQLNR
ncbi:hypothetical protein Pelo_6860 [Pelomyxa schiedti]|nr:hypothetical protein Pelo_6860 [Pelomyxa schiedti]